MWSGWLVGRVLLAAVAALLTVGVARSVVSAHDGRFVVRAKDGEILNKMRIILCVCVALVFAAQAAPASADPFVGPPICTAAGTALSGIHGNMTVHGNAYVANGKQLAVWGNLTLAPGSCLDAFTLGTVHVQGSVFVEKGAILALGCTPNAIGPQPPCGTTTTNDIVDGSVIADHALTMYLDGDHIHGDVVSTGGGPGPTLDPYINFPIKDNIVGGNVVVQGWQGAWFGALRNTVHGSVILTHNVGVTTGDSGVPDSTEVATNTITGDLICHGNVPAAQIGDSGGSPNTVKGRELGQCVGL